MHRSRPKARWRALPALADVRNVSSPRVGSGVRAKVTAAIDLTLWGTPLDPAYRSLARGLDAEADPSAFDVRHRHHGFAGIADDSAFVVAELIEVASVFSKRHEAVRWFVKHGRAGLLPPRILGKPLGIDGEAFERAFFEGAGTAAVEDDLRIAAGFARADSLVVTLGAEVLMNDAKLDSVLAAIGRKKSAGA